MTKKSIERNIQSLGNFIERNRRRAGASTVQKLNAIKELYEDRKIVQFGTAEKLMKGLTAGNEKELKKGKKAYDKAMEKYKDAKPIGERESVKKATEKAVQGRKKATINRRIRGKMSEEQLRKFSGRLTRMFRQNVSGDRKLFSVKYMLFSMERRNDKKGIRREGRMYYPLLTNPTVRTASVKAQQGFIESLVNVFTSQEKDRAKYKKLMPVMRTDKEFNEMLRGEFYYYIDAIRIENIELIDEDDVDYDVFADELTDANHNVSIFHKYVQTEVNPDCLKFKDAIMKNHHIENECWTNTLIDH